MNIIDFKRMLLDNCCLRPGGKGVWWRAQTCPFCGHNKWKFYLYIDINNESSVGYDCKRCNRKGFAIDKTILEGLGIRDVEVPRFKGGNFIRQNSEAFNDIVLLPDDANISKIQDYIYERIGVVPTFDELRMFQYVADPAKYCSMISSKGFNKNVFINRFCFKLSNGALACRYHNDTRQRWLKYSVTKDNGPGIYTIKSEFSYDQPFEVCISEGIFDAIGLYYHLNNPNNVYIACEGTNYAAGINHMISKGLFGKHVSIGIYKDGDVKNHEIRYNKRYKKLFKSITIYENVIAHDYGHPKSEVEIHKSLTEGVLE